MGGLLDIANIYDDVIEYNHRKAPDGTDPT